MRVSNNGPARRRSPPLGLSWRSPVVSGPSFVIATAFILVLPALTVVYLVAGFGIQNTALILLLWIASAAITVAAFAILSDRMFHRRL